MPISCIKQHMAVGLTSEDHSASSNIAMKILRPHLTEMTITINAVYDQHEFSQEYDHKSPPDDYGVGNASADILSQDRNRIATHQRN